MSVLEELGMIKDESSVLILGVAIIEDIIVISMLAILQSVGGLSFADVGISVAITLAFIAIRDMIAALFFVSMGALMDISLLPLFIVPALILIAVSLVAKFLTVYLAAKSQGFSKLTSLRAGIGLSSSGGELALVVRGYKFFFAPNGWRDDDYYHLYFSIYYQIRLEVGG